VSGVKVQTKHTEIIRELRRQVTKLEARVVGCEASLKLEQDDHRRTQANWKEAEADAQWWAGVADGHRRGEEALRLKLARRAAEVLSDAELQALAAEVQAELTTVPVTTARRRLRAALRARGVVPEAPGEAVTQPEWVLESSLPSNYPCELDGHLRCPKAVRSSDGIRRRCVLVNAHTSNCA